MIEEKTEVPNLEATRRDLIALRVKYGSDTPIGHRCSNLIGQLEEYENADGVPVLRRELMRMIRGQIAGLSKLTNSPQ